MYPLLAFLLLAPACSALALEDTSGGNRRRETFPPVNTIDQGHLSNEQHHSPSRSCLPYLHPGCPAVQRATVVKSQSFCHVSADLYQLPLLQRADGAIRHLLTAQAIPWVYRCS